LLPCWQDLLRQPTKKLLICWIADRTSFHTFLHTIFLRKTNLLNSIADTICLQTTDLLHCWCDLLRDDKFSELLTKFADIMNLFVEFAHNGYACWLGRSTILLKFSHHAHLSTAGAEWSVPSRGVVDSGP
jgi:hypothetical protein